MGNQIMRNPHKRTTIAQQIMESLLVTRGGEARDTDTDREPFDGQLDDVDVDLMLADANDLDLRNPLEKLTEAFGQDDNSDRMANDDDLSDDELSADLDVLSGAPKIDPLAINAVEVLEARRRARGITEGRDGWLTDDEHDAEGYKHDSRKPPSGGPRKSSYTILGTLKPSAGGPFKAVADEENDGEYVVVDKRGNVIFDGLTKNMAKDFANTCTAKDGGISESFRRINESDEGGGDPEACNDLTTTQLSKLLVDADDLDDRDPLTEGDFSESVTGAALAAAGLGGLGHAIGHHVDKAVKHGAKKIGAKGAHHAKRAGSAVHKAVKKRLGIHESDDSPYDMTQLDNDELTSLILDDSELDVRDPLEDVSEGHVVRKIVGTSKECAGAPFTADVDMRSGAGWWMVTDKKGNIVAELMTEKGAKQYADTCNGGMNEDFDPDQDVFTDPNDASIGDDFDVLEPTCPQDECIPDVGDFRDPIMGDELADDGMVYESRRRSMTTSQRLIESFTHFAPDMIYTPEEDITTGKGETAIAVASRGSALHIDGRPSHEIASYMAQKEDHDEFAGAAEVPGHDINIGIDDSEDEYNELNEYFRRNRV
jgi:hypothetical protein